MTAARLWPLDGTPAAPASLIGAKAYNLSLVADIAPVPRGVCLTTAFCGPILARWRENGERAASPGRALTDPERDLIGQAVALFEGECFSVRSSFVGEDGERNSFAGMYRSILNVRTTASACDAVVEVIASGDGDRARSYSARASDAGTGRPAILMQRMVQAEVSGVMFTAGPFGNPDEALVEASYGLGEAVVGGGVTPDLLALSRRGIDVLRRECGSKRHAIRSVPAGGVTTETVLDVDRDRICLSDLDAQRLLRIGLQLEARFGAPQDVEWALSGGQIWILQSRPVTAFAAQTSAAC